MPSPIAHPSANHLPRSLRALIGAMFFVSGAVALIYEAAWQREFTLLFGSAAPATAAVLAAYFTGLGLGAFFVGKFSSRSRHPLRAYAILELLIALGALLVTPILNLYESRYDQLFARFNGTHFFLILKCVLAFLSIVLPTFAMGGTLPVLAQLFESDRKHFGQLAGWLYVLNTIGAALGAFAVPHLLAVLGMSRSTQLCIATNIALAVLAFIISKKFAVPASTPSAPSVPPAALHKSILRFGLLLAFMSGFITFALQVGWNRAFAQVHENSIHSFTLLVTLFIVAIALGAQLARLLLRARWTWEKILGRSWLAAGVLLLFGPHLFVYWTEGLKFISPSPTLINPQLLTPAVIILLPIVLIAVSLPTLFHGFANNSDLSTANLTGHILSANIAGSVIGALVAGFTFPATLGLWGSFVACAALIAICAILVLFNNFSYRLRAAIPFLILALITYPEDLPRTRIEITRGEKLLALREGPHGISAVIERASSRRLKLNNHYILGGTSATGDERLQGHLPILLHPHPDKVAFLGYGTGITASSALFHNITNVLALELVPEVTELAAQFFSEANLDFAARHKVLVEDARNYLRGTSERFDVIINDLVVPWRHGEGALYTLEHFQAAKSALSPNGLFCSWVPMFQLGREDFEIILRTFLTVFPNAQIWRGDFSPREPALGLIHTRALPQLSLTKMQPDPANPHLQFPSAFWMHFVGTVTNIAAGPINREDRPIIELRSRRPPPFVGRDLAAWEKSLRLQSAHLESSFSPDQRAGAQAGEWMREFTLLLSEGRRAEALVLAEKIRAALGEAAANAVLGP